MNNRFAVFCLFSTLFASSLLAQPLNTEAQQHVKVSIIHPKQAHANLFIHLRGVVEAGKKITLDTQSSGVFHQKVTQDSFVKKGQLIGTLEDKMRSQELHSLKYQITLLHEDIALIDQKIASSQEMLKLGIISKDTLLTQQSIRQSKKIHLSQLYQKLQTLQLYQKQAKIIAPADGYITALYADGGYLPYGATVASLSSPLRRVKLFIDPLYASDLHLGQQVTLLAPRGEVLATIIAVLPFSSDNLIEVIAKPATTIALALKIRAKVKIKNVQGLIIPKRCIVLAHNKTAVFVIKKQRAHLHFVHIQKDMTNDVLIQKTLASTDAIVSSNAYMLRNNMKVEIQQDVSK